MSSDLSVPTEMQTLVEGLAGSLDDWQKQPVDPATGQAEAHLTQFLTGLAVWKAAVTPDDRGKYVWGQVGGAQRWRQAGGRLSLHAENCSAEHQAQLAGWVRFAEKYHRAIRQASST